MEFKQMSPPVLKTIWVSVRAALVAMALMCGACQSPMNNIPPGLVGRAPSVLAVGDTVKLTFPGTPELNQSQKIRADGNVNLPLVGEVEAAGTRVAKFQDQLISLYRSKLQNKEVIVTVEGSMIPVYVSGAVNRPGKITLDRSMTVFEAVMEANGFTTRANPGAVVLVRQGPGKHYTKTMDLGPALKGRPVEAFYLRPYDVIYVPESFF